MFISFSHRIHYPLIYSHSIIFFLCFIFFFFFLYSFFFCFFFFFSSRRRHTRLVSDWSSDVCSSDLASDNPRTSSTLSMRNVSLQLGMTRESESASVASRDVRYFFSNLLWHSYGVEGYVRSLSDAASVLCKGCTSVERVSDLESELSLECT